MKIKANFHVSNMSVLTDELLAASGVHIMYRVHEPAVHSFLYLHKNIHKSDFCKSVRESLSLQDIKECPTVRT